jgi:hypothetical protein
VLQIAGIGLHSGDVEGLGALPSGWEADGLIYIQSESNVMDGEPSVASWSRAVTHAGFVGLMPQWQPGPGDPYGSGLTWPRVFIANYVSTFRRVAPNLV